MDFRRMLLAGASSRLGTHVTWMAITLIAIVSMNASPVHVGGLAACQTAAFLVVGIPAGVLVDRFPRRQVMLISDLGRAVIVGSIPIAAWLDLLTLQQLYLVVFLTGVLTVFSDVAQQSFVPDLVPAPDLPGANGRIATLDSVNQVAGPSVAGALIHAVGAASAVTADVASYLLSASLISRIRHRAPPTPRATGSPWRRALAGARFLASSRPLRTLLLTSTAYNLTAAVAGVLLILLLAREIGLAASQIGWLYSVSAIGGLAGSVLARRALDLFGAGRTLCVASFCSGLGNLFIPFGDRGPRLALICFGLAIAGAGIAVYNVAVVTLRQRLTPADLLGRTVATARWVTTSSIAVGTMIGGFLADIIGIRTALWVVAGAPFCVFVMLALSEVARYDHRESLAATAVASGAPSSSR